VCRRPVVHPSSAVCSTHPNLTEWAGSPESPPLSPQRTKIVGGAPINLNEIANKPMLWPLVLPFQITFCVLAGLVALLTSFAPVLKWKCRAALGVSLGLAFVAFIPSCTGIMTIVDAQRFGVFEYDSFSEVDDFRVERFLPTQARGITLDKFAVGHRAKYSISESELRSYLDGLWHQYGEYSAIPRDELGDGASASAESFDYYFGDLGWPALENAIELHSPVESDGGGATYFFDPTTNTAYHRAGYW